MKYRVRHTTRYDYSAQVSQCYNLAYLVPRDTETQRCVHSSTRVSPQPDFSSQRKDYFGNTAYHFSVHRPHSQLKITTESQIDIAMSRRTLPLDFGNSCEQVRSMLYQLKDAETIKAREYVLDSPFVARSEELANYARPSFEDNRPLVSAVTELTERIFNDFTYDPAFTTVSTPLVDVMKHRRGVCQDFAHLAIGCLRSLGYPARYISGYLETLPPPGKQKLVGSDASHAWLAVYSPLEGWFEFDPTNNKMAAEQHIVTAWGRDYSDVTPLKGVIFGGGSKQILGVEVDVQRLE